MTKQKDSKYELLKILCMLIIVCHHFVAKNSYNIDVEISGISANKLFLQLIGNLAFIANNIFFMISAWFLYNYNLATSFKTTIRRIWNLEKVILFYSVGIPIAFYFFDYHHYISSGGFKLQYLIPLSSNLWWYPTSYVIFLLLYPYYTKGLNILKENELKTLVIIMVSIWTITTIIPVKLSLGASNTSNFFMLFAIVFYIRKYSPSWATKKGFLITLTLVCSMLAILSIIVLDVIGKDIVSIREYSCYYLRGNYRIFPIILSICLFLLWNTLEFKKSSILSSIGALTFAVYLIHMHPMVMTYLFERKLVLTKYIILYFYLYILWGLP